MGKRAPPHVMFWLRAARELMRLLADGILVHGPLLGWALQVGDKFKNKIEVHATGCVEHVMPVRDSLDEATYPWQQHAVDATEGTRKMMRDMGLWIRSDQGVAKRATLPTVDSRKNANLVKRAQALRTAGTVVQPTGFTFTVMDDARLSSVTLSVLSAADQNLPHGIAQFFGPSSSDVWSLFMQEKGDFLWAFKRTGPTTMDVYKVMGKTVQRANEEHGEMDLLSGPVPCPPVFDFHVYDCKPVPQHMGLLSTYQQDRRNAMPKSCSCSCSRLDVDV